MVRDTICNFCSAKSYKIANNSATTEARAKVSTDLESLEFQKKLMQVRLNLKTVKIYLIKLPTISSNNQAFQWGGGGSIIRRSDTIAFYDRDFYRGFVSFKFLTFRYQCRRKLRFEPCLVISSKPRACPSGVPERSSLEGKPLALPTNIRLSQKGLQVVRSIKQSIF